MPLLLPHTAFAAYGACFPNHFWLCIGCGQPFRCVVMCGSGYRGSVQDGRLGGVGCVGLVRPAGTQQCHSILPNVVGVGGIVCEAKLTVCVLVAQSNAHSMSGILVCGGSGASPWQTRCVDLHMWPALQRIACGTETCCCMLGSSEAGTPQQQLAHGVGSVCGACKGV